MKLRWTKQKRQPANEILAIRSPEGDWTLERVVERRGIALEDLRTVVEILEDAFLRVRERRAMRQ